MSETLKVLIVDDEAELRKTVAHVLSSSVPEYQFHIEEADNGKTAIEKSLTGAYDLIIMDVRMPEVDGLEALEKIKQHDPKVFILIMTAHANLEDAVQAIKVGAYDYVEKPVQPEKLSEMIKKAMNAREAVDSLALSLPVMDEDIETEFVGSSTKMNEVYELIRKLSQVETTVLVRGENGTGKELVANAIHLNSPRKHGEFVAINCGAIPESLMESELFGHEKGAFTGAHERKIGKFQLANKGTIFLDEIGELKTDMQVKLLRVLQERKFVPVGSNREVKTNARIIAATNRNLEKMIEDGEFREDLFYRLNVMPIFMPPLRERIEDMEGLAQYFIRRFNKTHHRSIQGVDPDALDQLKKYQWPGNIRELENVIERAFILEKSENISLQSIPDGIKKADGSNIEIDFPTHYSGPLDFDRFKEETEKEFIIQALKANGGRINKTVAFANIPKNTLLRKIKKYMINVRDLSEE
ncbi:MAG: sigma-54-dependent Fis family transcriptional regulator [Bdellovibrionales bacterium]|nr:sigma-54-dependent Fis family transcriptional regulator [Bdellovibrionales bacterium]